MSLGGGKIQHLFDSNEALQGLFIPNCEVPIELPAYDAIHDNDVIVITAVEYRDEIADVLCREYRFKGKIIFMDDL